MAIQETLSKATSLIISVREPRVALLIFFFALPVEDALTIACCYPQQCYYDNGKKVLN